MEIPKDVHVDDNHFQSDTAPKGGLGEEGAFIRKVWTRNSKLNYLRLQEARGAGSAVPMGTDISKRAPFDC